MNSIPNALRGRLVNAQKGTFWDWNHEDETLATTSGKLGQSGRQTKKTHTSIDKAKSDLESKHYKKLKEGFRLLSSYNPGRIAMQTWLTNEYTGFAAFDMAPDGSRIAASRHTGQGNRQCEIAIIDALTGEAKQVISIEEFDLSKIRFHDDQLVIQADDRISKLNLESGQTTSIADGGVFTHLRFDLQADRIMFSRSGETGPVIVVLDLPTGQTLLELDAREQRYVTDHHIAHVGAISPSGTLAALCRRQGEIEVFNLNDGSKTFIRGDFPCVSKLLFHPSENWLGFTELYGDWRFRLWSLIENKEDDRTESLSYTFDDGTPRPGRECYDFDFDPAGRLLILRDGGWLHVHNFETRQSVLRIEQRHVVKKWGTSGFVMKFAEDGRVITRTDRGVITLYNSIDEDQEP